MYRSGVYVAEVHRVLHQVISLSHISNIMVYLFLKVYHSDKKDGYKKQ